MKTDVKNEYKGKLAIVTGASRGIGYELAHVFAENGFNLIIAADSERIFEAAKDLEEYGVVVDPIMADLATYEGVESLVERIKMKGIPIHSLALNAGVGTSGDFVTIPLEKELNLIQLNIVANVHLTKKLLPQMLTSREGKILFTSSIAADMPGPYYAVYAASKAFVQSFAEGLRFELKDTGVSVTSLQPGPTDTNFFARAEMHNTPAGKSENKDDPRDVARDGFEALMEGRDHVVAGSFMNKVRTGIAKVLPQVAQSKVHSMDVKPDTHQ